jgi:Ca2+-binding RTX toxin-like protein
MRRRWRPVRDAVDTVAEFSNQGTDTVRTSLASYELPRKVENLAYFNASIVDDNPPLRPDDNFKGLGNLHANHISGGNGDDHLAGLTGNDTLQGGAGSDTFYFTAGTGRDIVRDFVPDSVAASAVFAASGGADQISIYAIAARDTWAEVQANMSQVREGVLISLGSDSSILLAGVKMSDLSAIDFVFAPPPSA